MVAQTKTDSERCGFLPYPPYRPGCLNRVVPPAIQSTIAQPKPAATVFALILHGVAEGKNAATIQTIHMATDVQKKTTKFVAFHSAMKSNPTMKPIVGKRYCGSAAKLKRE